MKWSPQQTARAPPVIQHNTLRERLAAGGDHNDIVLGISSRIRFAPMEFERFQPLRVQPEQQLRGKLVTVPCLLRSDVNEETVKGRGRAHFPLVG